MVEQELVYVKKAKRNIRYLKTGEAPTRAKNQPGEYTSNLEAKYITEVHPRLSNFRGSFSPAKGDKYEKI